MPTVCVSECLPVHVFVYMHFVPLVYPDSCMSFFFILAECLAHIPQQEEQRMGK